MKNTSWTFRTFFRGKFIFCWTWFLPLAQLMPIAHLNCINFCFHIFLAFTLLFYFTNFFPSYFSAPVNSCQLLRFLSIHYFLLFSFSQSLLLTNSSSLHFGKAQWQFTLVSSCPLLGSTGKLLADFCYHHYFSHIPFFCYSINFLFSYVRLHWIAAICFFYHHYFSHIHVCSFLPSLFLTHLIFLHFTNFLFCHYYFLRFNFFYISPISFSPLSAALSIAASWQSREGRSD